MDEESLSPAPDGERESVWRRITSRLRKSEAKAPSEIVHPPSEQTVSGEEDESVLKILQERFFRPPDQAEWTKQQVDIDSINLRNLPIGWQALTRLGGAINELKDDQFDRNDLVDIKPSRAVYPVLPMVASVVANRRNPEIPMILPTADEVKAMKPWLDTVEKFIGRFSENWARRFGHYIERKGQQAVMDIGNRIADAADQIQEVENPRQQFVEELTLLYNRLALPEYRVVHGVFEDWEEPVKIEDKVTDMIVDLQYVKQGHHHVYGEAEFPLLTRLLPITQLPPYGMQAGLAGFVGSELMDGTHTFLQSEGKRNLYPVPEPQEFNLFDFDSWIRGFAESFYPEKLERVKRQFPNVLSLAHQGLPENGPKLSEKIFDIAENICVLNAQGHTPDELAEHIFKR